jgi:hypothetical protein
VKNEIKNLGITMHSRAKWEKEKKKAAQWGKAALNNINMYFATVPNIKMNL